MTMFGTPGSEAIPPQEEGKINDLDVIQEMTEWMEDEDGPKAFPEALQDYYGNLCDDLHDSKGDPEYQAGVLERMEVVERWLEAFGNPETEYHITPMTEAEKASETEM